MLVLLPCHSLEDLSLDRPSEEAEQLMAAWSALFHPVLVNHLDVLPAWSRADYPSPGPDRTLMVVPPCAEEHLSDKWIERAGAEGATLIRDLTSRDELVQAALKVIGKEDVAVDPDMVADFLALGTCHLQVELLTRQLRYMSNLDEVQFAKEVREAAEAALQGDRETLQSSLGAAFDLLTEAREYFYPVETYLLDYTLVAPSTMGPELRADLAANQWTNMLISGQTLDEMADSEPESLEGIRVALAEDRLGLVGGEYEESELPLLPSESILTLLRSGLAAYERHLGIRPNVFGRRRFGLTPILPQILRKLGFVGAAHFTLDDGRFPKPNQSKMRWQGFGSTRIEALVRLPVDAARANQFLRLPETLGETMDLDHAATAVFAHWPGATCCWYEDIRRMAKYSPSLGKFVRVGDYFSDTECVGPATCYAVDRYRSPYLKQAIAGGQVDPISRWVGYYRRHTTLQATQAMRTLRDLIRGSVDETADWADLKYRVSESHSLAIEAASGLQAEIDEIGSRVLADLAQLLPREDTKPRPGVLTINPWSFTRKLARVSDDPAAEEQGRAKTTVELPSMGFHWNDVPAEEQGGSEGRAGRPTGTVDDKIRKNEFTESGTAPPAKKRLWGKRRAKDATSLAEENVLQNEFFRVEVDPVTGSMKSLHTATTRGNRMSQQLALRMPDASQSDDDWDSQYSVMAADQIEVAKSNASEGMIVARGRLLDRAGRRVAKFSQTFRVSRGSRVLDLEMEIEPEQLPEGNPWNSYYAARFAWADATVDVCRSVNSVTSPTDVDLLEAPQYIDLRAEPTSTTILTAGLPYHRRFGLRRLDSLLIVPGETSRRFRMGIGVDLVHPMPAALAFLSPQFQLTEEAAPVRGGSGWLLHLDCKNVVATHWEPIAEQGRVTGVRARLQETEGRACRLGLQTFRPIESARKVDFLGEQITEVTVESGRVTMEFEAHEWAEVEMVFAG